MTEHWDVLVVGGGHAGLEAAAAAARLGMRTAMIALDAQAVGRMSCNPAIGGIGKGQLAREVDALGGLMGRIADEAGIQFRLLNTSKGRAVQSPRAQCDRPQYERIAQSLLAEHENLVTIGAEAVDFLWREARADDSASTVAEGRRLDGLVLDDGRELRAPAVILTTGTFLEGKLFTGLETAAGGRVGERGAAPLGKALRALGLPTGRLKTGTPPRVATDSADFTVMQEQPGDAVPTPFSFLTDGIDREQVSCWLTRTNPATHEIVRDNLDSAPMYAGRIEGVGPRYCPSLEDKVMRFADRDGHTVFLEPEGYDSPVLYANGISTSLPAAVQEDFVRTIAGLEHGRILQPGYAVEYTFVRPGCLRRTLELRDWPGLYLAGQICGTSGYEEAAAQGLMAGLNAALAIRGEEPFVLQRHEAYIGVLIDDLVVSDPSEPYRMFTSRAEHRLLLRHDNADRRLTPRAAALGAVSAERKSRWEAREGRIGRALSTLGAMREDKRTLVDVLRRPQESASALIERHPVLHELGLAESDWATVEADLQYAGYARRQSDWVERGAEREARALPDDFDPATVPGLRREACDAVTEFRPETLGAASRLAGISPADLALLEVALVRRTRAEA